MTKSREDIENKTIKKSLALPIDNNERYQLLRSKTVSFDLRNKLIRTKSVKSELNKNASLNKAKESPKI